MFFAEPMVVIACWSLSLAFRRFLRARAGTTLAFSLRYILVGESKDHCDPLFYASHSDAVHCWCLEPPAWSDQHVLTVVC